MRRRDQILSTAAELFAQRGFHGVSVADLGAACGISGPALYKHFASKDAILAQMLVGISEELLAGGQARVASATNPTAALTSLVEGQVEFALGRPSLIVVQDRDWASLPDDAREQVRVLQLSYIGLWATELRKLHRDLTADSAQAMAHATFGLLNSTPHSARIPLPAMATMLTHMALRALGVSGR